MGGFDDVAVMGDWMPPIPSPRSLFSSMIGDDAGVRSIANSGSENKHGPLSPATEGQGASGNVDLSNPTQASIESYEASNSNVLAEPKMGSRGCLTERMAARAGFNAPRLNTESIRPADLSKNSEVRSPYLTIPAGLSPTTLLDSPVFLTNSLVLPSPTTGKFSFAPSVNNLDSTLMTDPDKGKKNTSEYPSSFVFKPNVESRSIPHFNAANQVFPGVGVSVHSNTSILHQNVDPPNFQGFSKSQAENRGSNLSSEQTTSVGVAQNSPPLDEPHDDDGDQKSSGDPNAGGGLAEDGYNWRKYGQKQVKGSEYPRSYYKCTHPNCPVKKKVERSHEGHITEIINKGFHNHLKPYRRSSLGSSNAPNVVQLEPEAGTGANGNQSWSNVQKGNIVGAPDWGLGNLEAGSSAPLAQEHSSGATLQAQNGPQCESGDGVDGSSTFSNDEDDEDRVTHGSISLGYDGEGDESESKRRRIETYTSDMSGATRAIREPRVVVQTTSEVDILDDGYRWRKYGQKVVKGNPNPRSYYKCTSAGCNVRKHVERASHDLKSVITTYEGKHNHGVPAARNSSHINSGGSNALPTQQTPAAAVSSHVYGPKTPQIRSSAAQFERPPLGSFGVPGRPQLGPGPGFGFGMSHPGLTGLGLGHHLGKLPTFPVHPYLAHQPRPMNGVGFMLPKAEPKLEPVTDSGMKSSSASALYRQLMSQLPLEPQM